MFDLFEKLTGAAPAPRVTDLGDLGSEFYITDSCAETGCGDPW